MGTPKNKIIWAVNPSKNPRDAKALVKEMKIWADKLNCEIQPVAVFSKLNIGFPPQINSSWEKNFEEMAKASLQGYLKKIGSMSFLKPESIFTTTFSTRKMAAELAAYAKKSRATLIFSNTRVKKAINPVRLGGFAEALISLSEVPVLLMNPALQAKTKTKSILYPTDLSSESKNSLLNIKPLASAFRAKLILFNQVAYPNAYASDFGATKQINRIMNDVANSNREILQNIQQSLKSENIKSDIVVAKGHKYLGEQIIEVARKNKVELIVVTNHAGPFYQAILGSVARDILALAKCPVLVLHHVPKPKSKTLKHKLKNADSNRLTTATAQMAT